MARTANTSKTNVITADDLHANDLLHGKGALYNVESIRKRGNNVTIVLWHGATYTVDKGRRVEVSAEHECDCKGSGIYSWGGSVNGIPLHTGEHFACHGKGWQDRSDVIRNTTYWNKYARMYA